jgi:hypothetical protein
LRLSVDEATTIALNALSFLVSSPERASRLLSITGLTPQQLRERTSDRYFLAGLIEHLLADESQLIIFLQDYGVDPKLPATAVEVLREGPDAI